MKKLVPLLPLLFALLTLSLLILMLQRVLFLLSVLPHLLLQLLFSGKYCIRASRQEAKAKEKDCRDLVFLIWGMFYSKYVYIEYVH
jgi:hypothetical protein